jgi:hypothetical protein
MNTSLLSHLFTTLKNPTPSPSKKLSFIQKIWTIIRVMAIAIGISFVLAMIIGIISNYTDALEQHAVADLIQDANPLFTLFFAVILAPLLEEIAFRLWLTTKRFPLAIGIGSFVFFYQTSFFPEALNMISTDSTISVFLVPILWFCLCILSFTLLQIPAIYSFLQTVITKHFRFFFYFSAFLFAIIHITNYKLSPTVIFLMPILISPQFFGGLLMGWVRTQLGFFSAILSHAFYNLSLLGAAVSIKFLTPETQTKIFNGENLDTSSLGQNDLIALTLIGLYVFFLVSSVVSLNIWLVIEYFWKRNKSQKSANHETEKQN